MDRPGGPEDQPRKAIPRETSKTAITCPIVWSVRVVGVWSEVPSLALIGSSQQVHAHAPWPRLLLLVRYYGALQSRCVAGFSPWSGRACRGNMEDGDEVCCECCTSYHTVTLEAGEQK